MGLCWGSEGDRDIKHQKSVVWKKDVPVKLLLPSCQSLRDIGSSMARIVEWISQCGTVEKDEGLFTRRVYTDNPLVSSTLCFLHESAVRLTLRDIQWDIKRKKENEIVKGISLIYQQHPCIDYEKLSDGYCFTLEHVTYGWRSANPSDYPGMLHCYSSDEWLLYIKRSSHVIKREYYIIEACAALLGLRGFMNCDNSWKSADGAIEERDFSYLWIKKSGAACVLKVFHFDRRCLQSVQVARLIFDRKFRQKVRFMQ